MTASVEASATKKIESVRLRREGSVLNTARANAVVHRVIGAVPPAAARAPLHHVAGLPAEVLPVEIATGREWAERAIPSKWWMDRGHCRRDVQRQE